MAENNFLTFAADCVCYVTSLLGLWCPKAPKERRKYWKKLHVTKL